MKYILSKKEYDRLTLRSEVDGRMFRILREIIKTESDINIKDIAMNFLSQLAQRKTPDQINETLAAWEKQLDINLIAT